MVESGINVRSDRRQLIYRQIHSKYQDDNEETSIKFEFIQKILIWMSACFFVCSFFLIAEFGFWM